LELKEALQIVHFACQRGIVVEPAFVKADFSLNALGAFGVIPEAGVKCLCGEVFYLPGAVIDVKDTSLGPPTSL
jgi:hypothetical protein